MTIDDVYLKIDNFRNKVVLSGEKPPHILTLSSDDIMWLMNPNGSRITSIFCSDDETDKLMTKVPYIVGKYKDVYIIQSPYSIKEKYKLQKAHSVLDVISDAIYNIKLMDDTKLSIVRDMLNYYNEEQNSRISDAMRGEKK